MTPLQKLLGKIYSPYRSKMQAKEWTLLLDALVNALPNEHQSLKDQRKEIRLRDLKDWPFFPGFKHIVKSYSDKAMRQYKKMGHNYKLSGVQVFSTKGNMFVNTEFIMHHNIMVGLKIEGDQYDIDHLDLEKITYDKIESTPVEFPLSEIEKFYESLEPNLKSKLNPDDIFDVDHNNRTYYAFYDMEDGNCLAVDKKLNVYSLVHDAQPMSKKLKSSFVEILNDIETKKFNKERHLDERYKASSKK